GDFWRDHRHFAADIGVIGAFDEAPHRPPVVAVPGETGGDQRQGGEQGKPPPPHARLPYRRRDRLALEDGVAHGLPRSARASAAGRPARTACRPATGPSSGRWTTL